MSNLTIKERCFAIKNLEAAIETVKHAHYVACIVQPHRDKEVEYVARRGNVQVSLTIEHIG